MAKKVKLWVQRWSSKRICNSFSSGTWKITNLKLKVAGRVKPAKLTQHFNATSCNIVKSSWEMLCRSWPNARNILQHLKFSQQKSDHFQTWSNTAQNLATCGNMLLQGGQRCATLHATILQDVILKYCAGHVSVSYPLVWFSLRLLRFYMTQLILILALCHCYQTLVPCARWIYSSLR